MLKLEQERKNSFKSRQSAKVIEVMDELLPAGDDRGGGGFPGRK